jgi:hypothetical protein
VEGKSPNRHELFGLQPSPLLDRTSGCRFSGARDLFAHQHREPLNHSAVGDDVDNPILSMQPAEEDQVLSRDPNIHGTLA